MGRFPFLNYFRERRKDLSDAKRIPADLCPDRLLFQFCGAPDERGTKSTEQSRGPHVRNQYRSDHKQHPGPHCVRPPKIAKVSFPTDDPDETEPDNQEGGETEGKADEVHS